MKYIDKSLLGEVGNGIVDDFLTDSWNTQEQKYSGADYDGLNKPLFRERIISLLLLEQEKMCCYCMASIKKDDVTIEHVIPQNIPQDECGSYFINSILNNNVIHRNNFNFHFFNIPPDLYPHDIAYFNIVASCDSHSHCNHYRSNKTISPFFYDPQIESKILYDGAGRLSSIEYEEDFEKVGISTDRKLIFIRFIWFKLASKFASFNFINEQAIDELILESINIYSDYFVVENFIGEPSYKSEIIKYSWFYHYYTHAKS